MLGLLEHERNGVTGDGGDPSVCIVQERADSKASILRMFETIALSHGVG